MRSSEGIEHQIVSCRLCRLHRRPLAGADEDDDGNLVVEPVEDIFPFCADEASSSIAARINVAKPSVRSLLPNEAMRRRRGVGRGRHHSAMRLEPTSPAVPTPTADKQHNDDDDQKSGSVHAVLPFVAATPETRAMRRRSARPARSAATTDGAFCLAASQFRGPPRLMYMAASRWCFAVVSQVRTPCHGHCLPCLMRHRVPDHTCLEQLR